MKSLILTALALFFLTSVPVYADLHDTTNSADYMIISTRDLIANNAWIQNLAAWRNTHGRTARVIATEDIYNEFGSGTPSDTVLKEFFHYARRHWQPPELRDVFIVGWHDVIPSHVEPDSTDYLDTAGIVHYWPLHYLSDYFYATDLDSNNFLPVLNIGRLPWSPTDSTPVWDYYAKVAAYETAAQETWQTRVHVIADRSDPQFNFAADFAEPFTHAVHSRYQIERDYVDYPVGDPWHGDRDEIITNLSGGSYLLAFFGHSGAGIWGPALNLNDQTFDSLTNGSRLPIVMGLGYDAGLNGHYWLGPIARSLVSNPLGGAIVYFGTTNIEWITTGLNLRLHMGDFATSDSVRVVGDIWRLSERELVLANPGSFGHILESPAQETVFGWMLFGDPGVRLPPRPSAVGESRSAPPANVELTGNYPNPFNPETIIVFRLSRSMHVALNVYDVLGRQVTTLLDDATTAGEHRIRWNAAGVAAGVYFAVLQTPGEKQVRKMLLLK